MDSDSAISLAAMSVAARQCGYIGLGDLILEERINPHRLHFMLTTFSGSKRRSQDLSLILLSAAVARHKATAVGELHSPEPELSLARDAMMSIIKTPWIISRDFRKCQADAVALVNKRFALISRIAAQIEQTTLAHSGHEVDQIIGHGFAAVAA